MVSSSRNLTERCLRIVYKDKKSNFEELLERDGLCLYSPSKYQISKVFRGISPQIVKEMFRFRDAVCNMQYVQSVFNGTESMKFL